MDENCVREILCDKCFRPVTTFYLIDELELCAVCAPKVVAERQKQAKKAKKRPKGYHR